MKQTIVLVVFGCSLAYLLSSYTGGAAAGGQGNLTGARGGATGCSCHSATTSIGTTVELDSAGVLVTSYHGGGSYTIKISAVNNTTHTGLSHFGFQLSAVGAANAGTTNATLAGIWGTLPTSTQNTATGSCDVIEHSAPITATAGTGAVGTTYIESIPWTAPAAGSGSVKLYGVINAVNNNGSSSGDYAQVATAVTITEAVAVSLVASVNIAITSGANPTCAGTSVTFTATPTNGGTAPTYQWKVNGSAVSGATASAYTTSALATGSVITCVMTSSLSGVTGSPATSGSITMTINPSVTPSVSISTTSTTICAGSSATFTATPTNGGTPSYQWKVNGTNTGTNSATFTTTTITNGQIVTCVMTSTATCASPATATSAGITMTVTPSVTPSVSIATPSTTVCTGSSVTFTATPTNGGTPSYQWQINGTNAGTNSATFTTATLTNGQIVTCVMTSTATCASPATATSNGITMTISGTVAPTISISTPNTTICAGSSVTFTATETNGGTAPAYQWKVGTANVGTNSPTYTTTALTNGQSVTCTMTSNSACASPTSVTSAGVTMTVNPVATPSVTIATPNHTICAGSSATFTATPVNGGTSPSYQWLVGGTNAGTNSATFTTTTLTNGQVVSCVMTSNAACVSPATATSAGITMTVSPSVAPSVTITTPSTTICSGSSVPFTATPANGGATPSYQWKVNLGNVGTNSPTYTTATLSTGQVVSCVLTSAAACASPDTAVSNSLTMTVSGSVTPSVTISSGTTTICPGTSVTFTAVPANGGSTPSYQWKVGAANAGTNSPMFTTSALTNGQIVTCIMTSGSTCASPATATSNAVTMTVTSTVTPTALVQASASTICQGTLDSFLVTGTSLGTAPSYQWEVNGANAGTNSPVFTSSSLANNAAVSCVITSSLACASPATATSNTLTITVTTTVIPTAAIIATHTAICQGVADSFAVTGTNLGNAPAYQWNINGSASGSNSPAFITTALANGNAVTCVVTSSATCASPMAVTSNAITIAVTSGVTPTAIVTASQAGICQGGADSFTVTGANLGTVPVYQWLVNGFAEGTDSSAYTTSLLSTGTVVRCVVTSNAACATPAHDTSNAVTVTIVSAPVLTVTPSGALTLCEGDSLLLTATGATSYQWTSGNTSSMIWVHQAGSYDVAGSTSGCPSVSTPSPAVVSIDTPLVPTATQSGNIITASTALSYQWLLNGANLAGDTDMTYSISQTGSYQVMTTDAAGCKARSVSAVFTYIDGIAGINDNLGVRLYPIPNQGSFIVAAAGISGADLAIYDIYGQKLYTQKLTGDRTQINGNALAPAIYFVTISDGGRTETIRMQVVKE